MCEQINSYILYRNSVAYLNISKGAGNLEKHVVRL